MIKIVSSFEAILYSYERRLYVSRINITKLYGKNIAQSSVHRLLTVRGGELSSSVEFMPDRRSAMSNTVNL